MGIGRYIDHVSLNLTKVHTLSALAGSGKKVQRSDSGKMVHSSTSTADSGKKVQGMQLLPPYWAVSVVPPVLLSPVQQHPRRFPGILTRCVHNAMTPQQRRMRLCSFRSAGADSWEESLQQLLQVGGTTEPHLLMPRVVQQTVEHRTISSPLAAPRDQLTSFEQCQASGYALGSP